MCGIVGYLGEKDAYPILIEALKKLEYRGYDSAGMAVWCDGKIKVARQKGKVDELRKLCDGAFRGDIGLAHTRWATHGTPSERNAHPHRADDVVVIHNGIVENYVELQRGAAPEGTQVPFGHGHGGHSPPRLRPPEARAGLRRGGPDQPHGDERGLCPRHHQGRERTLIAAKKESPSCSASGTATTMWQAMFPRLSAGRTGSFFSKTTTWQSCGTGSSASWISPASPWSGPSIRSTGQGPWPKRAGTNISCSRDLRAAPRHLRHPHRQGQGRAGRGGIRGAEIAPLEQSEEGLDDRVRHLVPLLPHRQAYVRDEPPRTGRGGYRIRVPLQEPHNRQERHGPPRLPVG